MNAPPKTGGSMRTMNPEMRERAMAHARAGAMFLDEAEPGWFGRVHRKTLDIGDSHHCALGQLYGTYDWGTNKLNLDSAQAQQLGFLCEQRGVVFYDEREYVALTAAWKGEIRIRRRSKNTEVHLPLAA